MVSSVGEFEKNWNFIKSMIKTAGENSIDVLLFPELCITGYTLDKEILLKGAEFFKNIQSALLRFSREYDMAIVLGVPRSVKGEMKNSLVVVKKKREILFYDKTHLFRKEKDVFTPGQDFVVFDFKNVKIGLLICYEIGFPEVSRILALRGAEILLASFAFGEERKRIYDTATKARAIENGAYLVTSSQTGKGLMDFIGRSRIISPSGEVLKEFSKHEKGLAYCDLDLSVIHHYRYEEIGDSHAYFSNRKPELYKGICDFNRV